MGTKTSKYERWAKLLLLAATCLLLIYFACRPPGTPGERPPEVVVKCDTINTCDTIYITSPRLADKKRLGTIQATFPIRQPATEAKAQNEEQDEVAELKEDEETEPPDSIRIDIPIEQKHYVGNEYEAWISGWNPSLDSVRIFRSSQHIIETREVTRWKTRHWGLSIGAGVLATPKGEVHPGVFVGVSYTFLNF